MSAEAVSSLTRRSHPYMARAGDSAARFSCRRPNSDVLARGFLQVPEPPPSLLSPAARRGFSFWKPRRDFLVDATVGNMRPDPSLSRATGRDLPTSLEPS